MLSSPALLLKYSYFLVLPYGSIQVLPIPEFPVFFLGSPELFIMDFFFYLILGHTCNIQEYGLTKQVTEGFSTTATI